MKEPMLMSSGNSVSSSDSSEPKEIKNSMLSSRIPTSPILCQRQPPPQPTASTSLDHLWSKQERFDSLELRLLALEDSERKFEHRIQQLEQPFRVEEQNAQHAHDNNEYMHLYITLLEQYDALKADYKQKEQDYQQQIDQLTASLEKHKAKDKKKEEESKLFYREEDGYLCFDSASSSGEITHYRVKIPPSNTYPKRQAAHYHFRSPRLHMMNLSNLGKGLNPNAPEWNRSHRF